MRVVIPKTEICSSIASSKALVELFSIELPNFIFGSLAFQRLHDLSNAIRVHTQWDSQDKIPDGRVEQRPSPSRLACRGRFSQLVLTEIAATKRNAKTEMSKPFSLATGHVVVASADTCP